MENERTSSSVTSPCRGPVPDLEVPMINTMVSCLGFEHRKLDRHTLQLALAATRLAAEPDSADARAPSLEAWDEIRRYLWSHLQIEDELVLWWGKERHGVPDSMLDALNRDRDEMRRLLALLLMETRKEPQTTADRRVLAQTLLALTQVLDSHVKRYDGQVLPAILRAGSHR